MLEMKKDKEMKTVQIRISTDLRDIMNEVRKRTIITTGEIVTREAALTKVLKEYLEGK